MEEILTELSKPVWWVSVVVAGIAINLISAYAKPKLDRFFSSISSTIRERSEKQASDRKKHLEYLKSDHEFFITESFSEIRLRTQSIYAMTFGVFIIVTINMFSIPQGMSIICMALSAKLFFMSYLAFIQAARKAKMISSAVKPNKSTQPNA